MRKFLLFLLFFLSLPLIAQIHETYTFDFSNPETLNPSLTKLPNPGQKLLITDKVFTSPDGKVSISFAYGPDENGAYLTTGSALQNKVPFLNLYRSTYLKINTADAGLSKISFSENSEIILDLVSTTPMNGDIISGSWDQISEWTSNGSKNISEVKFQNGGVPSALYKIIVTYDVPTAVLAPTVSPADNSTVDQIKDIVLTFGSNDNMSVAGDATYYTLSDGTTSYPLSATASGNKITLSPASAIKTDGTYTLTINEGAFKNKSGYENVAKTYTFKVVSPFEIQTISLPEGDVNEIPNGIILTFSGSVVIDPSKKVELHNQTGALKRQGTPETTATEGEVKIVFSNQTSVSESGIYTLTIPAGMVMDATSTHKNPLTKYTYNIGGIASDEIKAKATSLLAKNGLGYPKNNDATRTALQNMAATSTTVEYEAAIAAYLKSANVEMPSSNKWYYLSAVTPNGVTLFLNYQGGVVTLSNNSSVATPFKAVESEGQYHFALADGKYLLLPGISASSVGDAPSALTLAKLDVPGMDNEKAFGLFSIASGTTYARVNAETKTFATDTSLGLAYFINETYTNGFKLTKVADADVPVPDANYTLNPVNGSTQSMLTDITLTFPDLTNVTLASQNLIQLIKGDGTKITPASVVAATGTTNSFVISFSGILSGSYILKVGKGAFTYSYEGITASVQEISANYTVSTGDDYIYDLLSYTSADNLDWTTYSKKSVGVDVPIKDTDLNDFVFYNTRAADYGLLPASEQNVVLQNYYTNEKVTKAHFVVVPQGDALYNELPKGAHAIKLVLDQEVKSGSIVKGTYVWVIPAGTFGDTNFKNYQADKTSVAKNQCHVNQYLTYVYKVDNDQAGQEENPPSGDDKPSDAMLARAREKLAFTGVGYPTATNADRVILQNRVNNKNVSDDVMESLIKRYLESTDIELPATGKYYSISGKSADGGVVYVQYVNGKIGLTKNVQNATPFKATNNNGTTITFSTIEGKYLSVLSTDGISDIYSSVNNLFLSRLSVGDAEKTFGLVSMEGPLGGNNVYAQVNTSSAVITTADNAGLKFESTLTNGFQLKEVNPSDITAPEPTITLNPTSGASVTSLKEIKVTISGVDDIKVADKSLISLKGKSGNVIKAVSAIATQIKGQFAIIFPEVDGDEYVLTIGKGAFTFKFLDRTIDVKEIKASYTLLQYPSKDMLDYAKTILSYEGIGYPATNSSSRKALKALVESGMGGDPLYQSAIDAFLAETDIEKPATNKFYRIACKNNAGSISYLRYEDGRITMTASSSNAAAFQATANSNGTTTLATLDKKYLKVMARNAANVGTDVVNLTIARLAIAGLTNTETFGIVTMSANGKYSTVNMTSGSIMDAENAPQFTSNASSGFTFAEVDQSELQMPDVEYSLSPSPKSEVESLEKITLTFNTAETVSLADQSLITLVGLHSSSGTNKPKEVKMVKKNVFEFLFINLEADLYTLKIASGAFTVNFFGKTNPVQTITADYTLNKNAEMSTDFAEVNTITWNQEIVGETYVKDLDLNNLTLESTAPVVVDKSKVIIIMNSFGNEKARGHMEVVSTQDRTRAQASYVMKLVLDKEIKEGDLRSDIYTIIIPKATFGDENFGKYLTDPSSVSMNKCHVNDEIKLNLNVDNGKATGIGSIFLLDGDGSEPVYDLNGRRVDMVVPGKVYIKNGKKFVIK